MNNNNNDRSNNNIHNNNFLNIGLGVGAIYIPAFLDVVRYCLVKLHYPDDVGTYGLLSGLLSASLCLGSAIGAALGTYAFIYTRYYYKSGT